MKIALAKSTSTFLDLLKGVNRLRGSKMTRANASGFKNVKKEVLRFKSENRIITRFTAKYYGTGASYKHPGKEYYPEFIFEVKDNKEVPSLVKSICRARCTCIDYRHTWWLYNKKAGVHVGDDPPKYVPTGLYPEKNPMHVPGMCKHLIGLAFLLQTKKKVV